MARSADPCELTASVVVERSVQVCWDIYTNNALVSQWAPSVKCIECDEPRLAKNVIRKISVFADGKPGHTVEQCVFFDPFKRIEFNVIEDTFGFSHMLTSYGFSISFDVQDNHTLVVMQTVFVPKKIFGSLMNSKVTQEQLLDLMSAMMDGFRSYAQKK